MPLLRQLEPYLGPLALYLRKARVLYIYRKPPVSREALHYLLFDREVTNFTYDISNLEELRDFLASALPARPEEVWQYIQEVRNDGELASSLRSRLRNRRDRNREPSYARRMGWYCVVRLRKPRLVVETGTHDGLGSSILGRALMKNAKEGQPGQLLTFDITPESGWLLDASLLAEYQMIVGSTRDTLAPALEGRKVDLFIHDSEHTYENETFEMETVSPYLAEDAVILSDNVHACDAMKDFCARHGLAFRNFMEKPKEHFYPGASIGLALWRSEQ